MTPRVVKSPTEVLVYEDYCENSFGMQYAS